MNKLLTEWNAVTKCKVFEYEYEDEIYQIYADNEGLYTYGENMAILRVEWDDTFSLDEHLQDLYTLVVEE